MRCYLILSLFIFLFCSDANLARPLAEDFNDCDQLSRPPPDKAIRDCTSMLENEKLDSKRRSAGHLLRGTAYYDKGNLDKAVADFNQAIKLNPEFGVAYYMRGRLAQERCLDDQGKIRSACDPNLVLADFNRAIELNPKYFGTYLSRADFMNSLGEKEKAMADCKRLTKFDAKMADACRKTIEQDQAP